MNISILNVWNEATQQYEPIAAIRGEVGPQGEQGPQGPAYTLTDADKQAIVNEVISALPVYNGEVGE